MPNGKISHSGSNSAKYASEILFQKALVYTVNLFTHRNVSSVHTGIRERVCSFESRRDLS